MVERLPPVALGTRFGDWIVIEEESHAGGSQKPGPLSRVRCVCGTEKVHKNTYLLTGKSNGCGCRRGRALAYSGVKHNKSRTLIYRLWASVKHRLVSDRAYEGVRMHEPWTRDFEAFERFILSLGPKPTPQHTLDRIECSGHYEPGNLRWADKEMQSRNRDYPEHIAQPGTRSTHGRSNTALHRQWRQIKARLQNDRAYEHVKMHEPWANDFLKFEAFIESLGPKPTPQHTLDRIEPSGHYEPGNLRWADKKTQSENRRNNKHRQVLTKSLVAVGEKHGMLTVLALVIERRHGVTWYCAEVRCDCGTVKTVYQTQLVNGRTRSCGCYRQRNLWLGPQALEKPIAANGDAKSMAAWARELGVSRQVLWQRMNRRGWSAERAVTEPLHGEGELIEVNGESLTISGWSARHGVPSQTIGRRLAKGWEPRAAVTTPVRAWGLNRH